ncbi:hypothetical protein GCM10023191_084780 [Actinoallomurus oryzae]|uniref:WXG100 family type VII secretion target n=1 Tax=Actinoallomurus oryzae TaxID=502180 RepID=A0ABP8R0W9_9ACTN
MPSKAEIERSIATLKHLKAQYGNSLKNVSGQVGASWMGGGSMNFIQLLSYHDGRINRVIDSALSELQRLKKSAS